MLLPDGWEGRLWKREETSTHALDEQGPLATAASTQGRQLPARLSVCVQPERARIQQKKEEDT